MISQLSDKDFVQELRCLRMHLSTLLAPKATELLADAERRLTPGSAFANPTNLSKKKRLSQKREHQQRVNKYYFK